MALVVNTAEQLHLERVGQVAQGVEAEADRRAAELLDRARQYEVAEILNAERSAFQRGVDAAEVAIRERARGAEADEQLALLRNAARLRTEHAQAESRLYNESHAAQEDLVARAAALDVARLALIEQHKRGSVSC